MRIPQFVLAAAALLTSSAYATSQEWEAARPITTVAVVATKNAGVFKVSVTITDARSQKILATPVLLANTNTPATFQIGSQRGVSLRFTVTVDINGKVAQYRSETLEHGQVQSGYSGVLYVGPEA
jgi:hypothetical protein